MEDETTLSHKDNQEEFHTYFVKESVEGQLHKFIVAENMEEELAYGDSQKK